MPDSAFSLFLSRLDCAWVAYMHFLPPPLTIALMATMYPWRVPGTWTTYSAASP